MPTIDLAVMNEALMQLSRNAEHGPDGVDLAVRRAAVIRRGLSELLNPDHTPTTAERTVWGYCASEEADEYYGRCATREQAIAEGQKWADGEPFCVVRGLVPDPAEHMANLVENMCETFAENMEEDGNWMGHLKYPNPTAAAKKELETFLAGWLRRNCWPTFWEVQGDPEPVARPVATVDEPAK
jgi:hypothetical protein